MRTFFKLCACAAVSSLAVVGQASAYQQLTTYRIAGKDILSIVEQEAADENPAVLTLKVVPAGTPADELVIESDGDLKACKEQLEFIKGSDAHYAEIVIDMNAMTMNGVMVIQCASFYGLFGDGS